MLEELQRLETLDMVEGAGLGIIWVPSVVVRPWASLNISGPVSSSVKGASTHLWGSCED